jgi:hypothetical protein
MYNFSTLTVKQKLNLLAVINKYSKVKGDYEDTMLMGIVHGYIDSGILTDALSVDDAVVINKYVNEDTQNDSCLFELNDLVKQHTKKDLQCVTAINEIAAIVNDIELGAAYIASKLNVLIN